MPREHENSRWKSRRNAPCVPSNSRRSIRECRERRGLRRRDATGRDTDGEVEVAQTSETSGWLWQFKSCGKEEEKREEEKREGKEEERERGRQAKASRRRETLSRRAFSGRRGESPVLFPVNSRPEAAGRPREKALNAGGSFQKDPADSPADGNLAAKGEGSERAAGRGN